MIKFFIFVSLFFGLTDADTVIASWGNPSRSSSDYPNSLYGPFADHSSSSEPSHSFAEFFDRLKGNPSWSSRGYYSSPSYSYQQPQIYGNTGYTSGQINSVQTVPSGITDYNSYSSRYWQCINNYRGQFYYSYTYNGYVCDRRVNRNG